jgi:hypothetical protein
VASNPAASDNVCPMTTPHNPIPPNMANNENSTYMTSTSSPSVVVEIPSDAQLKIKMVKK